MDNAFISTNANVQQKALNPPPTTLTAFFALCRNDDFAKSLLYSEVPSYFTWNTSKKTFERRKRGERVEGQPGIFKEATIGRLYTVHPNQDECFFLRMLLVNVPGPTSFQQLKTVNGVIHATFRSACQALNLLENDQHWDLCINNACNTSHPKQIRALFAIILTACSPSSPTELWEKYKAYMAEDILNRINNQNTTTNRELSEEIYNNLLIIIEDLCLQMSNKLLNQLGMPSPNRSTIAVPLDVEFRRELNYDTENLSLYVLKNVPMLTLEQRRIYDKIMQHINDGVGEIFFLDAPGGTGKTFLIKLILAKIRTQNHIALALASSGIAATLLPGGKTAHSALRLPLNLHFIESPTCNISKASSMGKLLQRCKLIVWDECTMAHKKSLEALDRTLKDLRGNLRPFGNALILLAGDFRQTLPVIPQSTPADEINACLKYSTLWQHVNSLKLTKNVRVQLQCDRSAELFSNQLLDIGNGRLPINQTGRISLPQNFCNLVGSREELVDNVFTNIQTNYMTRTWLSDRAILAARNKDVIEINNFILSKIRGESVIYKSVDTVLEADEAVNYPIEFLNSLDPPGMPPHKLQLKIGAPIIMLRNIDQPKLCNGTRLAVKKLMKNVIEATILTGPFNGEDVLIPRIPMISTDMPFQFKRLQYPIRLAFAISINKAQGQSLEVCGIDLKLDCFSHGQLYVACSRVGKPDNLFILAENGTTRNVVYPQILL